MRQILHISVIAVLCAFALCACRSQGILDGSNGVIRYQQCGDDEDRLSLELVLVQETHEDWEKIVAEQGNGTFVKKLPSDLYEYLITTFVEECCFLDAVRSDPEEEVIKPRSAIIVMNEHGSWTVENTYCKGECDGGRQGDIFHKSFIHLKNVFDHTFSPITFKNEKGWGPECFHEQKEWLDKLYGKYFINKRGDESSHQ